MKNDYSFILEILERRRDLFLFGVILCIAGMGLFALNPASSLQARIDQGDPDYYFTKQLLWSVPGILGLFVCAYIRLDFLRRYALLFLALTTLSLLLVFVPGLGQKVSSRTESFHRWLAIGPVRFQPSEFAKISLLIYAAHILGKVNLNSGEVDFRRLILPFSLMGGVLLLILIGPQYGTTICTLTVLAIMIYLSGFPMLRLVLVGVSSIPLLLLGIFLVNYRMERFWVWLDPYSHRHEGGYQLVTAFRAFHEGNISGTDIGTGFAHRYLTFGHTDFILALFAEDFGVIGVALLFLLYVLFIWRSVRLLVRVNQPFYFMLGAGCLVMLIVQSLLNVAVVTGLVPTTGVSLPFFSYGGSSLVASFCMAGLLLNACGQSEAE
ncbi:MAG: FtsW/RodA/SpoVE family cell cycle protein [Leptospirales bacterium]|nr:FtsW/RodA/SpoVE family cell cycle protein [Leptospirales bacterium]